MANQLAEFFEKKRLEGFPQMSVAMGFIAEMAAIEVGIEHLFVREFGLDQEASKLILKRINGVTTRMDMIINIAKNKGYPDAALISLRQLKEKHFELQELRNKCVHRLTLDYIDGEILHWGDDGSTKIEEFDLTEKRGTATQLSKDMIYFGSEFDTVEAYVNLIEPIPSWVQPFIDFRLEREF